MPPNSLAPGQVPGANAAPFIPVEDPPGPPLPAAPQSASEPDDQGGRLGLAIPVLLAALGLAAAIIAWRAGLAGSDASDYDVAGLDATRDRAAAVIAAEGITAQNMAAYLDYERDRRRADALEAAGLADQALLQRLQATSAWFLVQPQYLDASGQYQPGRERSALLADAQGREDIQPAPHFQAAHREYERVRRLILAGVIMVLALPLLTVAEITRGRARLVGLLSGTGVFALGLVLAVLGWL